MGMCNVHKHNTWRDRWKLETRNIWRVTCKFKWEILQWKPWVTYRELHKAYCRRPFPWFPFQFLPIDSFLFQICNLACNEVSALSTIISHSTHWLDYEEPLSTCSLQIRSLKTASSRNQKFQVNSSHIALRLKIKYSTVDQVPKHSPKESRTLAEICTAFISIRYRISWDDLVSSCLAYLEALAAGDAWHMLSWNTGIRSGVHDQILLVIPLIVELHQHGHLCHSTSRDRNEKMLLLCENERMDIAFICETLMWNFCNKGDVDTKLTKSKSKSKHMKV